VDGIKGDIERVIMISKLILEIQRIFNYVVFIVSRVLLSDFKVYGKLSIKGI